MAQGLGIVLAGGWHHVVNRGNRRDVFLRTDTHRRSVPPRLADWPVNRVDELSPPA